MSLTNKPWPVWGQWRCKNGHAHHSAAAAAACNTRNVGALARKEKQ